MEPRGAIKGWGSERAIAPTGSDAGEGLATDGFALFLSRLRGTPLLTPAEEVAFARGIEEGDVEARRRLIEANLRLVVAIARTHQGRGLPLADLVQEGCLGLMRAVNRYDWRRGYRFTTYATPWIRQAMGRSIANTARAIRSPAHIVEMQPTVARVEQALTVRLAREPTPDEVGRETGLAPRDVRLVRRSRQEAISLSTPSGPDGDGELGLALPDHAVETPERRGEAAWMRRAVERALTGLSERERAVVQLRFGLLDDVPNSFAAVGRELGVTREAVRLIEARAFRKLERLSAIQALRSV